MRQSAALLSSSLIALVGAKEGGRLSIFQAGGRAAGAMARCVQDDVGRRRILIGPGIVKGEGWPEDRLGLWQRLVALRKMGAVSDD